MESATPNAKIRKNHEPRCICIASWVIFPQSSHQCASPHDRVTFYISMLMWWAFARPGSLISRMSLHALGMSHKLDHSVCVPSPLCSEPAPWGVMTTHFTRSLFLQCHKDAGTMLRLHGTEQSSGTKPSLLPHNHPTHLYKRLIWNTIEGLDNMVTKNEVWFYHLILLDMLASKYMQNLSKISFFINDFNYWISNSTQIVKLVFQINSMHTSLWSF